MKAIFFQSSWKLCSHKNGGACLLAVFFSACAPTAGQQNGGTFWGRCSRNIGRRNWPKYHNPRQWPTSNFMQGRRGIGYIKTRRRCKSRKTNKSTYKTIPLMTIRGLVIPMRIVTVWFLILEMIPLLWTGQQSVSQNKRRKYIDTGKVRYVFHLIFLSIHQHTNASCYH